jgi:amino acid transporter
LNRKQRQQRVLVLLIVMAVGVVFLATGVMDADWQAMQWHANRDNGEYWTFIPNVFVLQWYWAYIFTLLRLVIGPILIVVPVCVLAHNDI